MSDIALIQVVGRLTKDAQADQVNNQPDRLNVKFTVASSYYQYGQQDRPTVFYECRVFMNRKRWDSMGVDLKKGRTVMAWGEFRPRPSTGNDGKEKLWLNIEQGDFCFVGPKPAQTSSPGGYQQDNAGYPQPAAPPAGGSTPPGYEAPLPDGWTQQTDPSTQRPYYVGPNNQTQWERPQAPTPAAAPPATPPPAGPPSGPPAGGPQVGGPPGYPI